MNATSKDDDDDDDDVFNECPLVGSKLQNAPGSRARRSHSEYSSISMSESTNSINTDETLTTTHAEVHSLGRGTFPLRHSPSSQKGSPSRKKVRRQKSAPNPSVGTPKLHYAELQIHNEADYFDDTDSTGDNVFTEKQVSMDSSCDVKGFNSTEDDYDESSGDSLNSHFRRKSSVKVGNKSEERNENDQFLQNSTPTVIEGNFPRRRSFEVENEINVYQDMNHHRLSCRGRNHSDPMDIEFCQSCCSQTQPTRTRRVSFSEQFPHDKTASKVAVDSSSVNGKESDDNLSEARKTPWLDDTDYVPPAASIPKCCGEGSSAKNNAFPSPDQPYLKPTAVVAAMSTSPATPPRSSRKPEIKKKPDWLRNSVMKQGDSSPVEPKEREVNTLKESRGSISDSSSSQNQQASPEESQRLLRDKDDHVVMYSDDKVECVHMLNDKVC